jgi:hypothetical protein
MCLDPNNNPCVATSLQEALIDPFSDSFCLNLFVISLTPKKSDPQQTQVLDHRNNEYLSLGTPSCQEQLPVP